MKLIFLGSLFFLQSCASLGNDVSLPKPIRARLTDPEILESKEDLRRFPSGTSHDRFIGGVVICGELNSPPISIDGETLYKVKVYTVLYNGIPDSIHPDQELQLISPSQNNGGAMLEKGVNYRIYTPFLPDNRLAVWNGLAVEADCNSAR